MADPRTTRRQALAALAAGALPAAALAAQAGPARAPERAAPDPRIPERPGRTARTRFAVNVEMWWSSLPFLERVARAADLGFPAIEFWTWRDKDVAALARLCRERGIDVAQFTAWGFRPRLNDPAQHDAFVAEVEAACATAKELGAKLLTVVAGDDREGATRDEMHRHVADGLRRAAPVAERAGITLVLEPMNGRVDHPGHCLYGSAAGLAIVRAVGSPAVKLLFDLYHNQIEEGDLCGRLREGYAELGYVQVADHPGRHEPGTGEIHYPRVLRELAELGYRGFVGLECTPRGDPLEAARAVARTDRS